MAQGSWGKKSSEGSWIEDRLPLFFFLFMLFSTIYNLFFSPFNLFKTLQMKKALIQIEEKRAKVQEENKKLEQVLNSMEKNPDYYKEKFIREYMQLYKEGERVILFRD